MSLMIWVFMILLSVAAIVYGKVNEYSYLSPGPHIAKVVGLMALILSLAGLSIGYLDKKASEKQQALVNETCEKYDSGYAAYLEGSPVNVHTVALSEYKIEIDDNLKIIKLTKRDNSSSHSTVVPVIVPH